MNENYVRGKKIECIIGFFFLIPPILGVLSFVLCLFGCDWDFAILMNFRQGYWSYGGEAGMSAVPLFLGLMALAGVWLVKDSIQYLFNK